MELKLDESTIEKIKKGELVILEERTNKRRRAFVLN